MSEHTKGPWTPCPHKTGGRRDQWWVVPEEDRPLISLLNIYEGLETEQEANAHLIAAAPDLLEALEVVMESFDDISDENLLFDWQRDARRAITKAKGES